jgi:hypothetical protein
MAFYMAFHMYDEDGWGRDHGIKELEQQLGRHTFTISLCTWSLGAFRPFPKLIALAPIF